MADETIEMIIRQTNYDFEMAKEKLIEHNGDVLKVIRDYFKPKASDVDVEPPKRISKNQQIYKEIRGMMDEASRTYELKKQAQA
jgi:hypothetical protein